MSDSKTIYYSVALQSFSMYKISIINQTGSFTILPDRVVRLSGGQVGSIPDSLSFRGIKVEVSVFSVKSDSLSLNMYGDFRRSINTLVVLPGN